MICAVCYELLHKDGMTLTYYAMRFTELSCYTSLLVSTAREQVRRFIEIVAYSLRFGMA